MKAGMSLDRKAMIIEPGGLAPGLVGPLHDRRTRTSLGFALFSKASPAGSAFLACRRVGDAAIASLKMNWVTWVSPDDECDRLEREAWRISAIGLTPESLTLNKHML
jgi:hypothetical protein